MCSSKHIYTASITESHNLVLKNLDIAILTIASRNLNLMSCLSGQY